MKENQLKTRFKQFAISIIRLVKQFPNEVEYWTIGRQMIDAATSSAANYRATSRAKSTQDFIHKLKIVEEELDETMFWLELSVGVSEQWRIPVSPLYKEANELLSIIVASIKTSRNNARSS